MKALPTLIRMHKWQLDERRRQLEELRRAKADLTERAQQLAAEIESEGRLAGESAEAGRAYGRYLPAALQRRERLAQSLREIDGQIEQALAHVAAAYRELKRYEVAAANQDRRERAAAERREQAVLDEVALSQFRRKVGAH
jgi:flagellar export protein FliJ